METIAARSVILERMPAIKCVLASNAGEVDRFSRFPSENIETLAKLDLMGLVVPEAEGGAQASADLFATVLLELGSSCASTAMIFLMHCCGTEQIVSYASPSIRSKLLKKIVEGRHLLTLACSERGTGANFYASDTLSAAVDGKFALHGEKAFVTSAGHADSYVVATRAVDSTDVLQTTLYLVPKDSAGLSFEGTWDGLGLRGNYSTSMKLDGCIVPNDHVLGKQGQGLELEMSSILPRFLLGTAAVYNGIAVAALEASIEHLKSRVLSMTGESLSAFPVLRRSLAEMKVAVEASRALLFAAAAAWDQSRTPDLLPLFETKLVACETSANVCRQAMQLCGGIAYSRALPIERHLRDGLAGSVMAPTKDMLLDLIGRATLDMPLMD